MRKLFIASLIFILILGALAFYNYQKIFASNVTDNFELRIPTDSNFGDVLDLLEKHQSVDNLASFESVSGWMKYKKENIPSGSYQIKKGWNNKRLISKLRSGDQDAIKVTINNVRKIENLCGKFSSYLEMDSLQLLNTVLSDSILAKYKLNRNNILTLFIPNTYQFWWNSSPDELIAKMASENKKFWDAKSRIEKAEALNLTKNEVYTLASIVEKETQANEEKPRIAGVYLNRLKRGMMLQADPTVVFANNKFDLKRVLNKHLEIDSPYNTYKNEGLPPGPIYMPGIRSLDAVLNAEKHNYLYFCAKPDNSGNHAFATNLIGHNKNAQRYWAWLRKNRIR